MVITYTIWLTSIILWMLPPFRQRKGNYFLFFLILACSDLLAYSIWKFSYVLSSHTYSAISFLTIWALLYKDYKFNFLISSVFFIIAAVMFFAASHVNPYIIIISFQAVVLIYFIKDFILLIYKENKIPLFFIVIIIYELSVITKCLFSIYAGPEQMYYFYITTAFEIFAALFFIKYNDLNSPKIKLTKQTS